MQQEFKKQQFKKPARPFLIKMGKKLRPYLNRVLAHYSVIPDRPVYDPSMLAWVAMIEDHAEDIRKEWENMVEKYRNETANAPALRDISPDHARIAADERWKSFFLQGYGLRVMENCKMMPKTAALIDRIPNLNSAFFSILEGGAVIPPHYGVTKGLLTCHLGIKVPDEREKCWIDVDTQRLYWTQDKCILFDDTYNHSVKNETPQTRVVLLFQVLRPERGFGKIVQDVFMSAIRRSAFVKEAYANFIKINREQAIR